VFISQIGELAGFFRGREKLAFSLELFPAFLSQTFAGLGTPLDAGRDLLFINIIAAFPAFYAGFIRENFHFVSAVRTFMNRYLQVSAILTGAMTYHLISSWINLFPSFILRHCPRVF
jgi:hypothetical protein